MPIEVLRDMTRAGVSAFASGGGGEGNPVLTLDNEPATPAADTVRLFGRKIGGRMFPAYIDPSGLDSTLQPLIASNKIAWANPVGNGTALHVTGIALSATGTATGAQTMGPLLGSAGNFDSVVFGLAISNPSCPVEIQPSFTG